jgi:hypothetical protein
VFAKLLAGLTGKAGNGGELEAEGSSGTEKTARGLKNSLGKRAEAPGSRMSGPGNEKIQTRDRRFLIALQEEGEASVPEDAALDGRVKKSKRSPQKPEGEEALVPGTGLTLGTLPGAESPPDGPNQDGGTGSLDPLLRPDGAEAPGPGRTARRGRSGENADPEAGAAAAAALSLRERNTVPEDPGPVRKEKAQGAGNSRKNRERVTLEVRDLRTGGDGAALNPEQELANSPDAGIKPAADIVVELNNNGGGQENAQAGRAKTAGEAFEDILARELHQNLNGDIVRQASILVKDGGEGTIRLSLKPESLGMVKVRLEMAENKITGRIIVESNEALRAFEREIRSLEQAFRDSGFAGASLEMALAGDGGQNNRGQWDTDGGQALFLSRTVSSNYDAMGETMDIFAAEAGLEGFAGPGIPRVNVLA